MFSRVLYRRLLLWVRLLGQSFREEMIMTNTNRRNVQPGNCLFLIVLILLSSAAMSQTFTVRGAVVAGGLAVRNCVVSFTDQVDTSKHYSTLTDEFGNFQLSVVTSVGPPPTTVPQSVNLSQNYPNPFSSSTDISYELNTPTEVKITIYDILGREIRRYAAGSQMPGVQGVTWDGKDNFGKRAAAGVYFYKLQTKEETQVKKMVLVGANVGGGLPLSAGFRVLASEPAQKKLHKAAQSAFNVLISGMDATRPKILSTQLQNFVVQQDTSVSLQVELAIMAYSLCYERQDTISYLDMNNYLARSIHLNNLTGTNAKIIINWPRQSYDSDWSPDGKYIAFTFQEGNGDYDMYVYDTANDTLIGLVTSDTMITSMKMWTPDNKIIYGNSNPYDSAQLPYLMNPNGSGNRRIALYPRWVYPDGYTCLYQYQGDQYNIYRSNLDKSFDEFVFNCKTVGANYVSFTAFNPTTNELIINADPISSQTTLLLKYNIDTKVIDTVAVDTAGWMFVLDQVFSHDYKKIAVVEANYSALMRRISVIEDGSKTVLLEVPMRDEFNNMVSVEWETMFFSPDDKYLSFSKDVWHGSGRTPYLHVYEFGTGKLTYVDIGNNVHWNPKKGH